MKYLLLLSLLLFGCSSQVSRCTSQYELFSHELIYFQTLSQTTNLITVSRWTQDGWSNVSEVYTLEQFNNWQPMSCDSEVLKSFYDLNEAKQQPIRTHLECVDGYNTCRHESINTDTDLPCIGNYKKCILKVRKHHWHT